MSPEAQRIAILAAITALSLTGCQSITQHNAQTRADIAAGQDAAAQAKPIAAAALELARTIKPQPKP